MNNKKIMVVWLIVGGIISGCELPKKPNFKTSHKVEAPIMYNKTFKFMGDSTESVLIDTTDPDTNYDSLFVVDDQNHIIISKEQDFDFGDLNDAIPTISVDPTTFESQVGEIEITDFSETEGNIGEANFEDLTGIDPNLVSEGDPVPNQTVNPEVTIDLNTDLFESATFKNGSLDITLENNLGFDLDDVNVVLVSDPDPDVNGDEEDVADGNSGFLADADQAVISIPFENCEADPTNCQLFNPNVRVSIEWTGTGQTFNREPESLVVVSAEGNNLTASQVRAALDEQDFSTSSTAAFSDEDFEFTEPNHVVELKSGQIIIAPIENELEFAIELDITFTDIRNCPPSAASSNPLVINSDPLVISYSGAERIRRADDTGPGFSPEAEINIGGCELFAIGNEVSYDIDAFTENTKEAPPGDRIRVINELQQISSSVEISNLTIKEATGIIKQQSVLLNDDQGEDEILDLFNPEEAELTEIEGLSDLSNQLDNIEFTNPSLSINYFSNISVPTTIYGSFIGTNNKGEEVYLTGLPSSEYQIQPSDPIDGLRANGTPLGADEMIKFTLDQIDNPTGTDGTPIEFNKTNSNVDDFLNNLPNEIRFIGKAVINQDEQEATILDTLIFEPKIAINIPLAFATEEAATFRDTTAQDFSNIPSPDKGDKSSVTEGRIIINYSNGLPLELDLTLGFLDSLGTEFTTIPRGGDEITLEASGINEVTRFADPENPAEGTIIIAMTREEFDQFYRTKSLSVSAGLITFGNSEIKLRTDDSITLSVSVELTIESEVKK